MYGMTNAGGGGAGAFKKTATGSLTADRSFTVTDLSFRPRIVILYGHGTFNNYPKSYVCVGVFDKNGNKEIWRATKQNAAEQIDPEEDVVYVTDNGFSVTFGNFKSNWDKWPTGSTGAIVEYRCYG